LGAIIVLLSGVTSFCAPFVNLDFEQANTNGLYSYRGATVGPIEDLLPGWQVVASRPLGPPLGYTNSLQFLTFNSGYFDDVNVGVGDDDPLQDAPGFPKTGKYSVWVTPLNGSVSVSQRGDMPSNARGLVFDGNWSGAPMRWAVSLTETSQGFHWTNNLLEFGAFIPFPEDFAGRNLELRLDFGPDQQSWRIDAVRLVPALQMVRNQTGEVLLTVSLGQTPQVVRKASSVVGPWSDWQSVPPAARGNYPVTVANYPVTPEPPPSFFRLIVSGGSP
jgi:hypothetical protein